MKLELVIILMLSIGLKGNSQIDVLSQVLTIDPHREIKMLPNSKSYVKTVELFKNDELTQKYTEETFYNYAYSTVH